MGQTLIDVRHLLDILDEHLEATGEALEADDASVVEEIRKAQARREARAGRDLIPMCETCNGTGSHPADGMSHVCPDCSGSGQAVRARRGPRAARKMEQGDE